MKYKNLFSVLLLSACPLGLLANDAPNATVSGLPVGSSSHDELEKRADVRYNEMLGKMRSAVEEIAQLYGNPVFLQVFTNDPGRASELKLRLRSARGTEEIRRQLGDLEKRRDDLVNDIALREREVARLTERLVHQRAALEVVAAAVDQATKAVEDTTK